MKIVLLFIILAFSISASGQKAKISFDNRNYNFGKIEERQGKVSCDFTYTNKGDVPLIIRNVETSCGCTVPKWNRKPILPGESGSIRVTFNPRNRPGNFTKKITVYTNSGGSPNINLKISGEVVSSPIDIEKEYPVGIGSMRLNADTLYFDPAKTTTLIVQLWNTGKRKLSITSIVKPAYMDVDYTPLILLPGDRGNLIIQPQNSGKDIPENGELLIIRTDEGKEGPLIIKRKRAL